MTTQSVLQFFERFPNDDVCLEHLWNVRFGNQGECPKCAKPSKFHRVKKRPVYECAWCAHQISPMAGTPFEKSRTPLQKWFYAMYLFTTTRHGVSAKELQRQLSVTYKTAWRIGHEIRKYMGDVDGNAPLGGVGHDVEVDETLIGGSVKGKGQGYKGNKTCVVGMLERGGELVTKVVSARDKVSMKGVILSNVLPGSTIQTDEFGGYKDIDQSGYNHVKVNHKLGEYATKDGAGVNGIEAFWAQLKRGINGTHVHVSRKHLPKYLGEFEFRYNLRKRPDLMLPALLQAF
ncbi:IS1595 family transposase [Thalassospiraceae bacterium LMO-JJ14]|nr:IS1595 family transposase [Thalassospiraceae bacterium LMO-JJ14]